MIQEEDEDAFQESISDIENNLLDASRSPELPTDPEADKTASLLLQAVSRFQSHGPNWLNTASGQSQVNWDGMAQHLQHRICLCCVIL